MNVDAIFFDLGMVLVTFDWNIAIPRFMQRNGGDAERIRRFLAAPYHDAFERSEFSGAEFFGRGRALTGFQGSPDEFETYWNEIFTQIPENVELLQELAPRYPLYALSNTNPWHAAYLEKKFGWMNLFRQRYYSCDLGVRKPDARIFEIALERAGVQAARALFIDDRPENIAGARQIGMHTIHAHNALSLTGRVREFLHT